MFSATNISAFAGSITRPQVRTYPGGNPATLACLPANRYAFSTTSSSIPIQRSTGFLCVFAWISLGNCSSYIPFLPLYCSRKPWSTALLRCGWAAWKSHASLLWLLGLVMVSKALRPPTLSNHYLWTSRAFFAYVCVLTTSILIPTSSCRLSTRPPTSLASS